MLTRIVRRLVRVSMLTLVATVLLATIGIASASADTVTCAPNLIEYYNQTLIIQCTVNGSIVNYYGDVARPNCPNAQNLDTLKFWQSLAQGALLSGKNVRIYYTPFGGSCNVNSVTTVDLIK
jgi:hypothetical protein